MYFVGFWLTRRYLWMMKRSRSCGVTSGACWDWQFLNSIWKGQDRGDHFISLSHVVIVCRGIVEYTWSWQCWQLHTSTNTNTCRWNFLAKGPLADITTIDSCIWSSADVRDLWRVAVEYYNCDAVESDSESEQVTKWSLPELSQFYSTKPLPEKDGGSEFVDSLSIRYTSCWLTLIWLLLTNIQDELSWWTVKMFSFSSLSVQLPFPLNWSYVEELRSVYNNQKLQNRHLVSAQAYYSTNVFFTSVSRVNRIISRA